MKIRITKPGLFGNGPVPVGAEFTVRGVPPAGWAGKYEIIADEPAAPLTADTVAMPSIPSIADTTDPLTMSKSDLLEWLDGHGWDGDKRLGLEKLRDAARDLIED